MSFNALGEQPEARLLLAAAVKEGPSHAYLFHGPAGVGKRAAARTFPGNFLFSTGPNSQGGGKRTTRGHYDVPMRDCTVELDGRMIIKAGSIVDDAMRVKRVPR